METIAERRGIRQLTSLRERYGGVNWKKKKGVAALLLPDGATAIAEIHCYEAHGIGKVKMKGKRWL
jgi:hypothetical protein